MIEDIEDKDKVIMLEKKRIYKGKLDGNNEKKVK